MVSLVFASWRHYWRRYVATVLAVVVGVGFTAAVLALTAAAREGAGDAAAVQYSKVDVVAFPNTTAPPSARLVERIGRELGVSVVNVVNTAYGLAVTWPDRTTGTEQVSEIAAAAALQWQRLTAGVLPTRPGQVAVDAGLAAGRHVEVGDALRIGGPGRSGHPVEVVGLVKSYPGTAAGSDLFAAPGTLTAWGVRPAASEIDIKTSSGADAAAVAGSLRRVAPELEVSTAESLREDAVSSLTNKVDVLGRLVTAFVVVALFVTGLVIANTFRIVSAQRVSDTALLRCVGAQRWQVSALTLGEGMLLGLAASGVGTAVGLGLAAAIVAAAGQLSVGIPLAAAPPTLAQLWLPFVAGLATVVAALLPAVRRVAGSSPLAAARTDADPRVDARRGVGLIGAGVLLLGFGCVSLAFGVVSGRLAPGLVGGVVSFLGVLVVAPVVVPALIGLAGWGRRLLPRRLRGGVPVGLSVANALRNPRRTAATATALMVGVTLIVTMFVGAASLSETEARAVDRVAPVDVVVSGTDVSSALASQLRAVPGVGVLVVAKGATVRTGSGSSSGSGSGTGAVQVAALSQEQAAAVVRDGSLRAELARSAYAVIPVSAQPNVPGGGSRPFLLRGAEGSVRVRPLYSSLPSGPILVSPAVLLRLGGSVHAVAGYLRVSDGVDPGQVLSQVEGVLSAQPTSRQLAVAGGYAERSTYDSDISVMLVAGSALLAVAVLIALVGVGNTLSLSVLERGREHGLLRALGLTRRQLRLMLGSEALLMATTAALLGAALGVAYGWLGTLTILHGALNHSPALVVPVRTLTVVVVVAVAAGLVASVLPSRRAVRQSPVSALAGE